ncbi:Transcriptional regulator, PadR family [Candidatus Sulfopaludibacter sp. SbA3]|nr:Transcriptional regulator, PadR family [Candidatus Sulfopaludibacter sp. SbA3]
MNDRIELPQGTLDLLILRTLALEPQHGWGISERVQQMSSDLLRIQQGSLYPALHRLERRGWSGRRQLATEEDSWRKLTAAVAQVLGPA